VQTDLRCRDANLLGPSEPGCYVHRRAKVLFGLRGPFLLAREIEVTALSRSIFIVLMALFLAVASGTRADDSSLPPQSKSDRDLIELNKVLVIPQKCTPTDGLMACDPNANPPADETTPADEGVTGDPDAPSDPDAAASPKSADDPDATADKDSNATASAATAAPDADPTAAPDISNPDTPIPNDEPPAGSVASNDANTINPEYGTLQDYQQSQAEVVVIPAPFDVPAYAGTIYGPTPGIHTYYPNPIGGAYAAARITAPTYRPPFGPPGPWMMAPGPFGRAPGLSPAPMSFHHR
jgi:hypothetical protein